MHLRIAPWLSVASYLPFPDQIRDRRAVSEATRFSCPPILTGLQPWDLADPFWATELLSSPTHTPAKETLIYSGNLLLRPIGHDDPQPLSGRPSVTATAVCDLEGGPLHPFRVQPEAGQFSVPKPSTLEKAAQFQTKLLEGEGIMVQTCNKEGCCLAAGLPFWPASESPRHLQGHLASRG